MSRNDTLDDLWRDGFARAAHDMPGTSGTTRVEARVARRLERHRAQRRAALTAGAAVVVLLAAAGVFAGTRTTHHARVATTVPPNTGIAPDTEHLVTVRIDPGKHLGIAFPGRTVVDPTMPLIHVPSGTTTFVMTTDGTGESVVLRRDDATKPTFAVSVTQLHVDMRSVDLSPGRYLLYSTVPGHRAAGEQAVMIVGTASAGPASDHSLVPLAFAPPIQGAPALHATLDDRGVHFDRASIAGGRINLSLVDRRTRRSPDDDIALSFYVSGPRLAMISVRAGDVGGGSLCFGAVSIEVANHGVSTNAAVDALTTTPSPSCTTPVT